MARNPSGGGNSPGTRLPMDRCGGLIRARRMLAHDRGLAQGYSAEGSKDGSDDLYRGD